MSVAQFTTTELLFIESIIRVFNQSGFLTGPPPYITIDDVVAGSSMSQSGGTKFSAGTTKTVLVTYSIHFLQPTAIGEFDDLMSYFNYSVESQEFTTLFSSAIVSSCSSDPPAATCVHTTPFVMPFTVLSTVATQSSTFAPVSKAPSGLSSSSASGSSILSLSPTMTIVVLALVSAAFVASALFVIRLCRARRGKAGGEAEMFNLFSFDHRAMERESTAPVRESTRGSVEMPGRFTFFQKVAEIERDSAFGLMVADDGSAVRASGAITAPAVKRSSWASRMAKMLSSEPKAGAATKDDADTVTGSNQSYNANSNQAFVEAYFSRKSSTNESDMFSGSASVEYSTRDSQIKRANFSARSGEDDNSKQNWSNPMDEDASTDSRRSEGKRNPSSSVMQLSGSNFTMTL